VTTGSPTAGTPPRPGRLAPLKDNAKRLAHAGLEPVVRLLVAIGVGPDTLTAIGCIFSVFSGIAFFEGGFRLGAGLLLLSGVCDILDGQVARTRQTVSPFGAFLDSTLDRFAEAFVLVGIAGFYLVNLIDLVHDPARVIDELGRGLEPRTWGVISLTAMIALVGSFMVSYTRARAEGLGLDCRVGWFERPERLLLIMIAGAFGVGPVMPGALLLLTVLSFATAAQRVVHVWKETRSR
jgi:CDP-diacylglycerol--glycerol-3-phosphate 3-phosphatidyltransferase